jgi:sulfate permease, SulP family
MDSGDSEVELNQTGRFRGGTGEDIQSLELGQRSPVFRGILPISAAGIARDAVAGIALAAVDVPQALGYARIAGMPLITGLYTLLLPLALFAMFGSSRYLVVAADSATAAILIGGLSSMAPIGSAHYVALAAIVALLTGGCLLVARLFKLGFLADFLSQTVLVGFMTGVGFQVAIAMLGEMTRVPITSNRTLEQLAQMADGLTRIHAPTLCLAVATVVIILLLREFAPRFPNYLLVVAGTIAASATFDFSLHGIKLIQEISGGLPPLRMPHVSWSEVTALSGVSGSCFVMIVAQSAATAYAYASRHGQTHDENADLIGLAAANVVAGLSGSFVVNGSPTQTAVAEGSGARSQIAQLTNAAVVTLVLLFLTGPLHYLPRCVLGAVVFTIAITLVDIRGLRSILRESPGEFELALITAGVVVAVGVEQGILLASALSLLRHVRHSYRPHTAVLIGENGHWSPTPAVSGAISAPGLIIFQFGANLFYANAARFASDVRRLISGAPEPIGWLVVDAGAITSVDYSAALVVRDLLEDLTNRHVTLMLVHAETSLMNDLRRHHLIELIGEDHVFDTFRGALAAIDAAKSRAD